MNAEIGRKYTFIRIANGIVEHATFVRADDGSAYVECGEDDVIWEDDEEAWRLALADLEARGFVVECPPGNETMPDAGSWMRIVPHLQQLPGGASFCERVGRGGDPWPQIAKAMSNCTWFPADEFGQLLELGDFDVRWPLSFAAWYWGASGASVDKACAEFLVTNGLWHEVRGVLFEYDSDEWLSAWRTRFESEAPTSRRVT